MTSPPGGFDLALALRRTALAFRDDFAGIVLAGFVAVTLPSVAARLLAPAGGAEVAADTLRAVLAMLYAAMVSHGVAARLAGGPLPPGRFVVDGLRHARPGLEVALLLGAGVVAGLIVELFGRMGTLAGTALHSMMAAGAIWAICVLMPVVPVAVVERLRATVAIRRAAALTNGSRTRIFALLLVVLLTLAPAAVLVATLVRGEAVTLASPGLWLTALFELLAWGLAAVVPAVVYAGLACREGNEGNASAGDHGL